MRRILLSTAALALFFNAQSQVIFEDHFDSYTADQGVAAQSDSWDTWDGSAGLDGMVSTAYANSGANSAKIEGTGTDLVLPIGPYTTGAYEVSWKMYIPAGQGAYFNALHNWSASSTNYEWACDIFFDEAGLCTSTIGGADGIETTVPQDTWFDVKIQADMDNDHGKVWVNNVLIGDWQWSIDNSDGSAGTNKLAAVDFYGTNGPSGANGEGLYYIDDIKVEQVEIASVSDVAQTSRLAIFPNPADKEVNIIVPAHFDGGTIQLVDITGKTLYSGVIQSDNLARMINVSQYAQGLYFVRIQHNGFNETVRLNIR